MANETGIGRGSFRQALQGLKNARFVHLLLFFRSPANIASTLTPQAFTGGAYEPVGCRALCLVSNTKQRRSLSQPPPYQPQQGTEVAVLGGYTMSITELNGSEALAQRIYAFGAATAALCVAGVGPVTAAVLVLCASYVLAKVRA